MSVRRDKKFEAEVGSFFGEYLGTFTSARKQVQADIFREKNGLVAHVSFAEGFNPRNVTDIYLGELHLFAKEMGYEGRLRLVFADT